MRAVTDKRYKIKLLNYTIMAGIKMQTVTAQTTEYLINFQGQNYTVLVKGGDSKPDVKISPKTVTFKRWQHIKNAVLNHHYSYFAN